MKNSLTFLALSLALLTASLASAQEERLAPPPPPPGPVACPYPLHLRITGGPGAPNPAPVLSEFPAAIRPTLVGSQWNQTAPDKHFGHTFHFPSQKECCVVTKATLTLHIKALVGGPGASSYNDGITVYVGGVAIASARPWPTPPNTGATSTITIPIPTNNLGGGLLSVYVEDDTAVLSAELDIDGCCIRRP